MLCICVGVGTTVSYVESTHSLELEGADGVGGQLLGVRQRHRHDAVGLGAAGGPVLVAFDPAAMGMSVVRSKFM